MNNQERKTDNVILRIEPTRKDKWIAAATDSGMNLSRYITECVEKSPVVWAKNSKYNLATFIER